MFAYLHKKLNRRMQQEKVLFNICICILSLRTFVIHFEINVKIVTRPCTSASGWKVNSRKLKCTRVCKKFHFLHLQCNNNDMDTTKATQKQQHNTILQCNKNQKARLKSSNLHYRAKCNNAKVHFSENWAPIMPPIYLSGRWYTME